MSRYFIGIDIGTQGARVVLLSEHGDLVSEKTKEFSLTERSREEQSPEEWWRACLQLLEDLLEESRKEADLKKILSIGVTSTSGTVIPLDKNNRPLHSALMYSDKRAASVSEICKQAAVSFFKNKNQPAYTGFNASSGICKIYWFKKEFPEKAERINKWLHAADFISNRLCGIFGISDYTNSLKSGYDIFTKSWPDYLFTDLGLERAHMPRVVAPGTPIGTLRAELADKWGLPSDVKIVAGMTDGGASQIASGAVHPGDWNTTIGTTMVIKGVTEKPVLDPEGRLYNHLHPQGYFMPGGAGNTGADWVALDFQKELDELSKKAEQIAPSEILAWPLRTEGERFPLLAPQARGFLPDGLSKAEQFTANMEGVAFIEKYAYEMIQELSGEKVKAVYTAGGGSKSDIWLKIRSSVLKLPIYKMKYVSGAVGAAILAASQTHYSSLSEAGGKMTQKEKTVFPEKKWSDAYERTYRAFLQKLKEKNYLKDQ